MQSISLAFVSIAWAAVGSLGAQQPVQELLVPIHAQPDDPTGSRYGVWAGGPDYKVRFDGGLEYFPALGSAYDRNLPIRWRTSSARIGAHELATGRAKEVRVSDSRYEYRFGGVVEAYDVRPDGIEQTFRIGAKSSRFEGDLVVRGSISSELVASPREPQHAPIAFRDAGGRELVRYGAATAIDADGRAFPMTSAFDGDQIELRLGADDVARATFPLLVDPLIGNDSAREAGTTAVASVPNSGQDAMVHVYTRISSATDHDVFAVMSDLDFNLTALIWADLGSHSSQGVAIGGLDAIGRVVIAAERRDNNTTDLFLYSHDTTQAMFGGGVSRTLIASSGEHYRNPDVGGARTGEEACIVYDYEAPSVGQEIRGRRFHALTSIASSFSTAIAIDDPTVNDRLPAVTPYGPEWVVSWIVDDSSSSDIVARKVFANGSLSSTAQVIQPSTNNVYEGVQIAGENGRYVATYSQSPLGLGATAVRARRFDWSGSIPDLIALTTLSLSGSGYQNGEIAFDRDTASHWIATFQRDIGLFGRVIEAARIGDVGAVIEVRDIHGAPNDQPFSPAIASSRRPLANAFPIVYATSATPDNSVLGELFEYPPECFVHAPFGSSCGSLSEFASPTIAGSREFSLALDLGTGFVGLAACFLSPLQTSLPLDAIGMNGCSLLVEPALGVTVPATISANEARVTFSLGGAAPFLGFFNSQWVYSDGSTALGLATNPGLNHESR